jgi:hypothetical protein
MDHHHLTSTRNRPPLRQARAPRRVSDDNAKGKIKVVYSGDATDEAHLQKHIRRQSQNKVIQQRAKNADDELALLIVQSMLLNGFDSPPLHTIYIDKPMRGAALMQALARVNRTFRNKQDGLLVGYAPLTENLYEGWPRTPPATRPPSTDQPRTCLTASRVPRNRPLAACHPSAYPRHHPHVSAKDEGLSRAWSGTRRRDRHGGSPDWSTICGSVNPSP